MLNLGMGEILLFAMIALVILGPDKLPQAARFAGRWYGKIRRMVASVQHDIDRELRMAELRDQMEQELKRIQQLEAKMQSQLETMQQQVHPQTVAEPLPVVTADVEGQPRLYHACQIDYVIPFRPKKPAVSVASTASPQPNLHKMT